MKKKIKIGDLVKISPKFYERYLIRNRQDELIFVVVKEHVVASGIICGKKCHDFKWFSYDIVSLKDNSISMQKIFENELEKI